MASKRHGTLGRCWYKVFSCLQVIGAGHHPGGHTGAGGPAAALRPGAAAAPGSGGGAQIGRETMGKTEEK